MARSLAVGTYPGAEHSPHWPHILGLLERGASINDAVAWSPGDVVWVAIEGAEIIAAATTRMLDPDTAELMNVGGVGVRMWAREWDAKIADWARAMGARRIVTQGRKGWKRLVEPFGWKVTTPSRFGDNLADYQKVLADDE